EAFVVDIGGTAPGLRGVIDGFPRQATVRVDGGGLRTNFRMPDILSIGLGGGSRVHQGAQGVTVGPDSVGFRLHSEGLIFGGDTLTASDIAVARGQTAFGDPALVTGLPEDVLAGAARAIAALVDDAIDRMKTSPRDITLILVGGGAVLVSDT